MVESRLRSGMIAAGQSMFCQQPPGSMMFQTSPSVMIRGQSSGIMAQPSILSRANPSMVMQYNKAQESVMMQPMMECLMQPITPGQSTMMSPGARAPMKGIQQPMF